ncbi:hypothetical protein RKD32_001302 [Streptomyces sp. SAI-195]
MRSGRPGGVPGAEEVVRHRVVPVDVLRGARVVRRVDLAAGRGVGRDRRGDQVVLAELGAQGAHQLREGVPAAGVAAQAAGVRVLPVDVDAVEDVGPPGVLDQVVAGLGERLRVLRGLGEAAGPGPAAERPEDLQVGVLLLQLEQLVEVAAQRLVPGVRDAVHGVGGGVGPVGRRVGVAHGALAAGDVAERVVDVGEFVGGARRLDVLDVVAAVVDAPFGEVADDLGPGRRLRGGCLGLRGGGRGRAGAGQQPGAEGDGAQGGEQRPDGADAGEVRDVHRVSPRGGRGKRAPIGMNAVRRSIRHRRRTRPVWSMVRIILGSGAGIPASGTRPGPFPEFFE